MNMNSILSAPLLRKSAYTVRLADGESEIQAAQRLRFEVFNLELHEGLTESFISGLDQDPFDAFCDHLIVTHEPSGKVVGTYRMQTGQNAALHRGYYCEQEFDFAPFEDIRSSLIELGRACVHEDHRNVAVLGMLWRGIAAYARDRGVRYLIGCSSLTSQDPALGSATYAHLARYFLAEPNRRTCPLPAYGFPLEAGSISCPPPPKLLRAYLGIGARICGAPAIDREFGTIDFLTFLDLQTLSPMVRQHFLRL